MNDVIQTRLQEHDDGHAHAGGRSRAAAFAFCAMLLAGGCTMAPDYKGLVLETEFALVNFFGFLLQPNKTAKIQLFHNPSGQWVDVATTQSDPIPTGAEGFWGGAPNAYRWLVSDIASPAWSSTWWTPTCEVPVSSGCGSYVRYRVLFDNGQALVPTFHMNDPLITGPGLDRHAAHALGCFMSRVLSGVPFFTAAAQCLSPEPFEVRVFSTFQP